MPGKNIKTMIWNITIMAVVISGLISVDTASAAEPAFDYRQYATVLNQYVNEDGLVNYSALKSNRQSLDKFILAIGDLSESQFRQWNSQEQVGFLINAYNAIALLRIINHYPIEPSFPQSFLYPDNSIRQIDGVFDDITTEVMNRQMTLDYIEHEILRKKYTEPRIHMALVCAAMSCPPLCTEPYTGEQLDSQLEHQTRTFLKNPSGFRMNREEGVVYLSSIFKWFGEDFIQPYDAPEFQRFSEKESTVLKFISEYLNEEDRMYLESSEYKVKYLKYDWSLNTQKSQQAGVQ